MKNLKKLPIIISILSLFTFFLPANADIKVVASIKPIHSLASYLMNGVAKPDLIVDGYASPHGFAMKPSHAKMLQNADLIFWVGEDLENFLEKPLGPMRVTILPFSTVRETPSTNHFLLWRKPALFNLTKILLLEFI